MVQFNFTMVLIKMYKLFVLQTQNKFNVRMRQSSDLTNTNVTTVNVITAVIEK